MNPSDFDWTNHAEPTVNVPFTALVDGNRIPILPVSDTVAGCEECVRRTKVHARLNCFEMPNCGSNLDGDGVTFLEDTPENRALYVVALITGKPMTTIPEK